MKHNKPNGGYCDRCGCYNTLVQDGYDPALKVCKQHRLPYQEDDIPPVYEDLTVQNARVGEIVAEE